MEIAPLVGVCGRVHSTTGELCKHCTFIRSHPACQCLRLCMLQFIAARDFNCTLPALKTATNKDGLFNLLHRDGSKYSSSPRPKEQHPKYTFPKAIFNSLSRNQKTGKHRVSQFHIIELKLKLLVMSTECSATKNTFFHAFHTCKPLLSGARS